MDINYNSFDPGFFDEEDIIAKTHFVEHMDQRWPYGPAKGVPFSERINRSLSMIPDEYKPFALVLFANVIYLPENLLRQSWRYLAKKVASELGVSIEQLFASSHLVEIDPSGLISDFMHDNGVEGRLDINKFSRLQSVEGITKEIILIGSKNSNRSSNIEQIISIFHKKYWLVLSDNILSGTSAKSDYRRCEQLIDAYHYIGKPEIIPITQILTSVAEDNIGYSSRIHYAMKFDQRFRVANGNGKCCLFNSASTMEGVIKLSKWLASSEFFKSDERLTATIERSGDDMSLGFKGGGWTIVTPNCPTNSLPLLWYEKNGLYSGPYPRIMSRTSQKSGNSEDLTSEAINFSQDIKNLVEKTRAKTIIGS